MKEFTSGVGTVGCAPQKGGSTVSERPQSQFGRNAPELARGMSLAFEFVGAVVLFLLVGWLVDEWLGTEPWGQVVGSVIGWVGGTLHVYYKTLSMDQGRKQMDQGPKQLDQDREQ